MTQLDWAAAQQVMERCAVLGGISEEPGRLTRPFATEAMRRVNAATSDWMQQAGMAVRSDHIGNLIGRYESDQPQAKTLLLGSHLDTVRDAGMFDGPLGVLVALACVAQLPTRQRRLPFAIEVLAFADEEGLRYHSTYLGSSVVAGTFDPANVRLCDAQGVSLAEAIRAFGGDPERLTEDRRASSDLLGYCEVHIEQGPLLESLDLPVGVVTAIAGQSRISVGLTGVAGHAGTVPMNLRRDALCAAAAFVSAVEALGQQWAGLVATVGQMQVEPGASNVIPGVVTLSLDVRHASDDQRRAACATLHTQAEQMCAERGIALHWNLRQDSPATPCTPCLIALLDQAVAAQGYAVQHLISGAGHDAVALAPLTDVAMMFVRCKGGISHNPAESVTTEDVAVAIATLGQFLELLARKSSP